jgi:transglutaminase-like putative cysteine protease
MNTTIKRTSMRLVIQHSTHYRYDTAPKQWVQLLRLTPRTEPSQRIIDWHITTPGKSTAFKDAFGNESHSHVHTLNTAQNDLLITVEGIVELEPLIEGKLLKQPNLKDVPPLVYLVPTALTEGFYGITELAHNALPQGLNTPQDALRLAQAINQVVQYTSGITDANSTAKEAFELSSGVCQDHAHVMIAACRALGVSARYVSGYVDPGNSHAAASHAWVDVYLNQAWYSVDVTNVIFASDVHCRLAVGRDYLDASPIRGVRDGGNNEHLNVTVKVHSQAQDQDQQ